MSENLTLLDIAKRMAPDSEIEAVAEIMSEVNPILKMLPFKPCNNGTVNKEPIRTGYPSGFWRRYYQGIPQEKSTYVTVQDDCGMLTAMGEVDASLADHSPNKAKLMLDENRGFIEGLSQTMADAFFYADSKKDHEKFTGLTPRFAKVGHGVSGIAKHNIFQQVMSAGGTTANSQSSVWIVAHDVSKIFGLYPAGSTAGLNPHDHGRQLVADSNGNKYPAYIKEYQWDCGLGVKDWRYVARLANVEVAALSGTTLIDYLVTLTHLIQPDAKNVAIYANRDVVAALDVMAVNKANMALGVEDWAGRKVTTFRGYPILQSDALVSTEAVVSNAS